MSKAGLLSEAALRCTLLFLRNAAGIPQNDLRLLLKYYLYYNK